MPVARAAQGHRDRRRASVERRTGGRLSARSADRDVRLVAAGAGLELSAYTLCHTCLTGLVRSGNDLVMVAQLAGHHTLETPLHPAVGADRQRADEDVQIDF
jgi:site-specific recombinase XerD